MTYYLPPHLEAKYGPLIHHVPPNELRAGLYQLLHSTHDYYEFAICTLPQNVLTEEWPPCQFCNEQAGHGHRLTIERADVGPLLEIVLQAEQWRPIGRLTLDQYSNMLRERAVWLMNLDQSQPPSREEMNQWVVTWVRQHQAGVLQEPETNTNWIDVTRLRPIDRYLVNFDNMRPLSEHRYVPTPDELAASALENPIPLYDAPEPANEEASETPKPSMSFDEFLKKSAALIAEQSKWRRS